MALRPQHHLAFNQPQKQFIALYTLPPWPLSLKSLLPCNIRGNKWLLRLVKCGTEAEVGFVACIIQTNIDYSFYMSPGIARRGEKWLFSYWEAVSSPHHSSSFGMLQDVHGAVVTPWDFQPWCHGCWKSELWFTPVYFHPTFRKGPAPPVWGMRLVPVPAGTSVAE